MRRVVVTGIGLVTPVGNDTATTWAALCAGTSGIAPITSFDASALPVRIAGEVRDLDLSPYMDRKEQQKHDRFLSLGVVAAMEALQQARLDVSRCPDDIGIIIGSAAGGMSSHQQQFQVMFTKGAHRVSPHYIHQTQADALPGHLAVVTGARGPNFAPVAACASGTMAIGESYEIIRRGDAYAMIAGGADSTISPICIGAFANAQALSRRNGEPASASRPFAADRDGFVMSEGAGILILEELDFALARGATILGEISGYGLANDAYHITNPPPDGAGLQRAMLRALAKADLAPTAIHHINAHGTATKANDSMETTAIKAVFGAHAPNIAISATKSMLGHAMGAAGAIEAAVTVLSLARGTLTPTINLEVADPHCDLDYVPQVARPTTAQVALSNSVGFGGHNASLVIRAWTPPAAIPAQQTPERQIPKRRFGLSPFGKHPKR